LFCFIGVVLAVALFLWVLSFFCGDFFGFFFCFVTILFLVALFLFHLYLGNRRSFSQRDFVRKILDLVVVVVVVVVAKAGAS
jgi:hypothetical protein